VARRECHPSPIPLRLNVLGYLHADFLAIGEGGELIKGDDKREARIIMGASYSI
jgi:hypothetical protein